MGRMLPCIPQRDSPTACGSQVQHGSGWSSAGQPAHLWLHLALGQASKPCTCPMCNLSHWQQVRWAVQRTAAASHTFSPCADPCMCAVTRACCPTWTWATCRVPLHMPG